ncbi:type II toxin-antitoxin system VapC family toxin [Candidatus Lokiarchaeum ossiferum]|uniref:type II toxin-antitoxin system VapC family toxin n=1 Tax=Candidatus Lokiarchaeum ossiferum TaxID=2951803 RepID=UPI00352F6EBE
MKKVCFDTGIFLMYFGKDSQSREKILSILKGSLEGKYEIHVLKPVISEIVCKFCLLKGKDAARNNIYALLKRYPFHEIPLDYSLLFDSGILKAQDRIRLSYNDCFSITYCVLNKIPFHTTEKKLKNIPLPTLQKLKVVTYEWI